MPGGITVEDVVGGQAYRGDAPQPVENLAVISTVEELLELGCWQRPRSRNTAAPGSLGGIEGELPGLRSTDTVAISIDFVAWRSMFSSCVLFFFF